MLKLAPDIIVRILCGVLEKIPGLKGEVERIRKKQADSGTAREFLGIIRSGSGIQGCSLMLFDIIFNGSIKQKWYGQDDFPSCDEWIKEINKWFIFGKINLSSFLSFFTLRLSFPSRGLIVMSDKVWTTSCNVLLTYNIYICKLQVEIVGLRYYKAVKEYTF